ncbi:MAG: hypothetical protein QF805_17755, partial [Pirellulaceae bacterium]|nr:hypothetical protein [Pirellulaceae bacterium]
MSDHVVQKEEPSQSPAIEMSLNEVVDAVRRIEERTAEELRAVKDAIASLLEQSAGSAADDDSSTRSAANVAAEEAAESAPPAVETQPPEPAPAVAPAPRQVAPQQVTMATPGGIANSLLGVELAEDYNVAADSQALLNGVWSGEPAAIGLVGQLLVFRSATIERMAQLLKDIGEAYYRWRPESA